MTGTTGLGSLPGVDVAAGIALATEEATLPWLPEFPARGPWAGMIGRATGVLAGLDAELSAGQWQLASASGVDQRRARTTWRDDLDRLQEAAPDLTGPLKVPVTGPWTLAASLLRPRGGRVLADRGARRDLGQSLAQGVDDLLDGVRRRLPGAEPVLQIDEPSLPAVLAGRVPTEGGYFRHRSVSDAEVAEALAWFTGLGAPSVLHCCAPDVPVTLLTRGGRDGAGFGGLALDGSLVTRAGWDALAAAVEAGTELHLGLPVAASAPGVDEIAGQALGWLRPLELGPVLADRLLLTHPCGLAGAEASGVRGQFRLLRRAAAQVDDALRS